MAAVCLFLGGLSVTKEYILLVDIYRSEIKPSAVTNCNGRDLLSFECSSSGRQHAT